MKVEAIYIGSRKVCYEERINQEGKKMPAFDGKEYIFCYIDRDDEGNVTTNFGYTLSDRREKGKLITDIEEGLVTIGSEVIIKFNPYDLAQKRFTCQYSDE